MKKNLHKLLMPAFVLLMSTNTQAQRIITTIGGNGTAGFTGDGSAATVAEMSGPSGVAVDHNGKIYVVDKSNARVRTISKTGVISTIAGTGVSGYNGSNISATTAKIDARGIAVDYAGNVYIADQGNNCIRKVNTAGLITIVAGDTTMGFSGDNGPATAALLSSPAAVALDKAGNLYIADQGNNRIRKVSGGTITTVAGGGSSGLGDGGAATAGTLNYPTGVAVDTAGNIYIVDQVNNRIRMVNKMGIISTFAGTGVVGWTGDGGAAVAATFNYPISVAVDDSMHVFVAEGNNNVVRMISGGNIYTIAGTNVIGYSGDNGAATAAKLNNPAAVAVDSTGKVYIADDGNNRVRKVAFVSHVGVAQTPAAMSNISLIPNPNNGTFTVSGFINSLNDDEVIFQITDMLGRCVYNTSTQTRNGVINEQIKLSGVTDGMYLLQVHSGAETKVSRLVLQK